MNKQYCYSTPANTPGYIVHVKLNVILVVTRYYCTMADHQMCYNGVDLFC